MRFCFISFSLSLYLSQRLVYRAPFDFRLFSLFDSPFDLFCLLRLLFLSVWAGGVEPPQLKTDGLQPLELANAQRPHTRVLPRITAAMKRAVSRVLRILGRLYKEEGGSIYFVSLSQPLTPLD